MRLDGPTFRAVDPRGSGVVPAGRFRHRLGVEKGERAPLADRPGHDERSR